jgi:hypothetical protein
MPLPFDDCRNDLSESSRRFPRFRPERVDLAIILLAATFSSAFQLFNGRLQQFSEHPFCFVLAATFSFQFQVSLSTDAFSSF